jgi:hypothetical protein
MTTCVLGSAGGLRRRGRGIRPPAAPLLRGIILPRGLGQASGGAPAPYLWVTEQLIDTHGAQPGTAADTRAANAVVPAMAAMTNRALKPPSRFVPRPQAVARVRSADPD